MSSDFTKEEKPHPDSTRCPSIEDAISHERLDALTNMARGVSHDFNNVLMPILGYADFLIQNPDALNDTEEALEMIGVIKNAALSAREGVRRLQYFYRPPFDSEMDLISISALFEEVKELTSPRWKTEMQDKDSAIRLNLDAENDLSVMGRSSCLQEALTNLIDNSIEALSGGGDISLFASSTDQGKSIVIKVTDTGVGMEEDIRRKCIEPFFTTKAGHGAGLGLAMVHGIVRRHRGTLEIDSTPGKGTVVAINLPAAMEVAEVAGRK